MRYSYLLVTAALGTVACDVQPNTAEAAAGQHAMAAAAAAGGEPEMDCGKCPHAEARAEEARAGAPKAPEPRVDIDLASAPVRGDSGAPVTIVVYSDFQCPFCKRGAARIEELTEKYGRDVRFAFKNYPLPFHDHAARAAAASVAAQNQGKFWEMHDRLFAQGAALDDDGLVAHARALGLDVERFKRDLEDPSTKARVDADIAEGQKYGVQGTPTFFVSGERMVGAQPLDAFVPVIDRALARR